VLVLPITVLMAVVLLSAGQNARIKGDAAIAMLSVSALSVGYLLFNLFPPTGGNISGDVCTTLFGATSILTLTQTQVWQSVGLSALVVLLFVFTYHRLFAVTFDENFARATGTNARAYNVFIAIVIATVVVLAMELVGSLLISALLIFPAISAMGLFKSFRAVVLAAAAFGVSLRAGRYPVVHPAGHAGGRHHCGGGYCGLFSVCPDQSCAQARGLTQKPCFGQHHAQRPAGN
jgi:zinc transport system permease protein